MRGSVYRVLRALLAMFAVAGITGAPVPRDVEAFDGEGRACVPRAECCRVCRQGKACGNSCISEQRQCHKGRGCACDEEEVCE